MVLDIKYPIVAARRHMSHINEIDLYTLKILCRDKLVLLCIVILVLTLVAMFINPVALLSLEAIVLFINLSKEPVPAGMAKLDMHLSKHVKGLISGYYKAALVVLTSHPVQLLAITIVMKLVLVKCFPLDFAIFLVL